MVFTRKFSEFPAGTLDQNVGLDGDVNTRGPSGGGGGPGPGVTHTFPQQVPPVTLGHWVRVTPGTGVYVDGQADDAMDAEIIGVIVDSNALTFTLQQSGYIESSQNVFVAYGALTIGNPYFLDTLALGLMTLNDATINGTISRPVFVADSASSGWVLPYRGLIVGQGLPNAAGGGGTDTSIVTIAQNNDFIPGDIVRVNTPPAGAPITYVRAQANTLANSQAVGIVCLTPPPTATQFTLQFSGYNIGAVTQDDMGVDVVAPQVLYLSSTVPGKLTAINPIAFSKPMYVVEQGTANLGNNAGYILPQRPLNLTPGATDTSIHTVIQDNTFDVNGGQWLYIDANGHYGLAQADTLDRAQVAGLTLSAINGIGGSFVIQQSGFVSGKVTGTYVEGPLNSAQVYYLSLITPGKISTIVPTVGQVSKPCYVQENSVGNIGEILPQRPLIVTASGSDPTLHQITQPGNTFGLGDWLYISADNVYTRGISTSLASSQVVGLVSTPGNPTFTIQTNGYNTGAVFGDPGLAPGVVMYLSPTIAGRLQSTAPNVVGQFTKPCYIQEHAASFTGDILEQRPLSVPSPPIGGGNLILINTYNLAANPTGVVAPNIFIGYTDITIIFRNVVMVNNGPSPAQYYGQFLTLALATGGVFDASTTDYHPDGHVVIGQYGFPMMVTQGGPPNDLSQNRTNGATINLPGGLASNWQIYLQGIATNGDYKMVLIDNQGYNVTTLAQTPQSTNLFCQFGGATGNFAPLTGFKTMWGNGGLNQFAFVSGTVSVYGTLS